LWDVPLLVPIILSRWIKPKHDSLLSELHRKCIIKYKLAGKQKSFSLLGIKTVWLRTKLSASA